MGWNEVNLAGISDEMELLPDGQYVFALLAGAKFNQWDANKIDVAAKVSEGEFAGRVQYFSYPDPTKQDWSPQALKKLSKCLVADGAPSIEENQDPVAYLNQDDVVGKRFIAPVARREYESQDGEKKSRLDIKLFKIRPVA